MGESQTGVAAFFIAARVLTRFTRIPYLLGQHEAFRSALCRPAAGALEFF